MWLRFEPPQRADAQQIGAVFDAAVAEGWKYLGDLARLPMFPPEEWDKVVAEAAVWVVPCSLQTCECICCSCIRSTLHAPPNALLVAVSEMEEIAGFTAVHPLRTKFYGLPAAERRFCTRTNRTKGRSLFMKQPDIAATARFANRIFEASTCGSPG